MSIKQNVGRVYHDENAEFPLGTATAIFGVFQAEDLTITKVVDRPDAYYYEDDIITFTITITNNGELKLLDLIFRDTIDPIVKPISGTEFIVTTTIGTIVSKSTNIEITNITLNANQSCVITITGQID